MRPKRKWYQLAQILHLLPHRRVSGCVTMKRRTGVPNTDTFTVVSLKRGVLDKTYLANR